MSCKQDGRTDEPEIVVLGEAANDIDSAFEFYEEIEFGLGFYFVWVLPDSMLPLYLLDLLSR